MTDMPPTEPTSAQQALLLGAFERTGLGDIEPILQCRFHVENWRPECAEHYGINIPEHMARAVPKRLAEFVAGRALARQLLTESGCDAMVGHSTANRAPLWPAGYLGSITHSDGIAACTLMEDKDLLGVGIDIEHYVSPKTADQIGSAIWSEKESGIFQQSGWNHAAALTAVFSAKESLFKALYPRCQKFFGFTAAEVRALSGNRYAGQLSLVLTETLCSEYTNGQTFTVYYQASDERVMTGLKVCA